MTTLNAQERGTLRSKVTKAIKLLTRRIAENTRINIESQVDVVKHCFSEFEKYHILYHETLQDDSQIEASEDYFDEIESSYIKALTEAYASLEVSKAQSSASVQEKTLEFLDNATNLAHLTLSNFDGSDYLEYLPWITVFDDNVHSKNIPDSVKLARLLQYTSGTAHRQIRHCPLDKSNGYVNAREILKTTYGSPHTILFKTMEHLKEGPPVVTGQDIVQLGNDLQMALNTINDLKLMSEVDNQLAIKDILKRCPQRLQDKYYDHSTDYFYDHKTYPSFKDFVKFIKNCL